MNKVWAGCTLFSFTERLHLLCFEPALLKIAHLLHFAIFFCCYFSGVRKHGELHAGTTHFLTMLSGPAQHKNQPEGPCLGRRPGTWAPQARRTVPTRWLLGRAWPSLCRVGLLAITLMSKHKFYLTLFVKLIFGFKFYEKTSFYEIINC